MKFQHNDGGRAAAGFKGNAGDCFARAVAIATGLPYQQVYDLANEYGARERTGKRKRGKSDARTGVYTQTARKIMQGLGWQWVPTMHIGSGCKVHLTDGELPAGRLIVCVSRHYTAVIDGVIHDTHNPQRATLWQRPDDGTPLKPGESFLPLTPAPGRPKIVSRTMQRCVYGYFQKAAGVFDETAERSSIIAKYELRVTCKCGWSGSQADLVQVPASKRRKCPACSEGFIREQELHKAVRS